MINAKLKPDWAGKDFLSQIVNVLIKTKPLYSLMKLQARKVLIKTAEKNGVQWRKTCQELDTSEAKELLKSVTNPNIKYPDYYQVPFHAYDEGNLCWLAAYEAEPATKAMGLRVWPKEQITWETAEHRLRSSFHEILGQYCPERVENVLDIGCSVGMSTLPLHRYLVQKYGDNIRTVGLDLSPYMLAVAKVRDKQGEIAEWKQELAENTSFPDNSFDVITLQFLLHELPNKPSREIFQEAFRILRPGGCLAIVDNNPKSEVIQNLPPALFILMKSTEPWSDEYYTFDVEETLKEVGFDYKITLPSDPRHRTIIALKP
ncbi:MULTISPECIES: class I SAM-dependent methyltransferase [Planktothrix]|uniref:Methyltransferase type 11 n=1 Tax=Planktothrix rubescens CCAP 1459/22 TaxID=329571 RepID=A0A6J7ZRC8_PLARU|nr:MULTISPECIES: class I SAM-dependent methyltransferase [Planktothrix]CAC5345497.1 Methyltransferase type 11 [Planktothrix rubescens NIVA-CYA 18]CAD5958047.1 2-phytyl-1,4-naphtoquinone methyltransferase [Planktothrix rubescens NIVA-CYA 18]